jgi:hypothetical protein
MNKPHWISFCGWAALACVGVLVGGGIINAGHRPGVYPVPASVAGIALLSIFPLLGLWALGSIVYRLQRGSAKLHAAALVEAQQRAGVNPLASLSALKRPPLVGAAGGQCALCVVRPAVVRRVSDGVLLCSVCLQAETGTSHGAGGGSAAAGA